MDERSYQSRSASPCEVKVGFVTREAAEAEAKHLVVRFGGMQRAYHCPACLYWHLSTKRRGQKSARRKAERRAEHEAWRSGK